MRPRLVILSPTNDHGGAEAHMLMVAFAARDAGWDVTVSFESGPGTLSVAGELGARNGIRYVNARVGTHGRRWPVLRQMYATARLLQKVRPHAAVVIVPWPTFAVGCMLGTGLPAVPTAVIFCLADRPVDVGRWRALCRGAQARKQQWVAVSDQNRGAIAETFAVSPSSVRTIYNGVPTPALPAPSERAAARVALRQELDLPPEARVILTVGRLEPQKGHSDLLQILPRVLEGRTDVFFVWVGHGELRPGFETALRGGDLASHARILGPRSDVTMLLRGSDLFLLPSRSEGLPFALLEAMAEGIPVVTSDAGGNPEVVRNHADGLIHRREDPAHLAMQLCWALDHPSEMALMGASGQARVTGFSRRRMLNETVAVLDDLLTD